MDYTPKGIRNLGNTCFLSTVLQILCQCKPLNRVLETKNDLNTKITEYRIFENWNDMRKIMHSTDTKGSIIPRGFVNWFLKVAKDRNSDIFLYGSQCDTGEFLHFFVDCLHECMKRSMNITIHGNTENGLDNLAIKCYTTWKQHFEKDYSEMKDMFYGISVSMISSMDTTQIHSSTCEVYFTLELPVSNHMKKMNSIYECLDVFTEEECLQGENAWYNDKTNAHEDVKKKMMFWNFPTILVVCFKRFSMDGSSKEIHMIQFPQDLDLTNYCCGYKPSENQYELFGICNHFGNLETGHYTNFVKTYDRKWYHCNDEIIQEVKNINHVHTQYAYCLFYRKKNNEV